MRRNSISGLAYISCLVLSIISMVAYGAAETKDINVDIDKGVSRSKNVGCGFYLIEKLDTKLIINLHSDDGQIVESTLVSTNSDHVWVKKSEKKYVLTGLAPNEEFWCVIKARIKHEEHGGGGGGGEPPWRWMSVSDVDYDGDTNNDSNAKHRPPGHSIEEDRREYPINDDDKTIGLIVPMNDDNNVSWERRDNSPSGSMDRHKDEEILDLELKINAKKAGTTKGWGLYLSEYDEDGNEIDSGDEIHVAEGVFSADRRIEQSNGFTGADDEHIQNFTPDSPSDGYRGTDWLRYLIVGTDLDVDSDNSGEISDTNIWRSEDFFENHPASEIPPQHGYDKYKWGMIVFVNDDSDDGDTDPDNGWNGTDWSGPEANTVVADEDDLKPLVLRSLDLDANEQSEIDTVYGGANISLSQVGGDGKIRVFTTGSTPQALLNNSSKGAADQLPDGTSIWDILKGTQDLKLQVEGLEAGDVVLEVKLVLGQLGYGPVIHTDRVKIKILKIDIRNPIDSDGNGKVDDPASEANNLTGNEFTYSAAKPGALQLPVRVRLEPDTADVQSIFQNNMRILVDPIDDSHTKPGNGNVQLIWDNGFFGEETAGNGVYDASVHLWKAKATFKKLPPENNDYGKKTVTVQLLGVGGTVLCDRKAALEVFWPLLVNPTGARSDANFAKNHPGADLNSSAEGDHAGQVSRDGIRAPNWMYYWGQVVHVNDGIALDHLRYMDELGGDVFGCCPAIVYFANGYTGRHDRLLIGEIAQNTDSDPDGSGPRDETSGIDAFRDTVVHENYHAIEQSVGYTSSAFGTAITGESSVTDDHWSFNIAKPGATPSPPLPPGRVYNHYNDANADGDFLDSGEDLDTDGDSVINSAESGTVESLAWDSEPDKEDGLAASDWGSPGKNHATDNDHTD